VKIGKNVKTSITSKRHILGAKHV